MTPPVTRRQLLIGAGVAAALPTGWLATQAAASRSSVISGYLRSQLPGLAVSDTNLRQFADTFIERQVAGAGRRVYHEAIFLMLANPGLKTMSPEVVSTAFDKFSRSLLTRFLQSTDFFGAAQQQPEGTTYLGYADPYEFACSNLLANLELET